MFRRNTISKGGKYLSKKESAGILIYQLGQNPFHININGKKMREDLYLLGHYGGPFFEKKDLGTWTIPKGEIDDNEDIRDAALRELKEETGYEIKEKENLLNLQSIKQKSGKIVYAWGFEDKNKTDANTLKSNTVEIEYPHNSGKKITFPEMDKFEFFNYDDAIKKINISQQPFLKKTREYLILKNLIDAKNL